MDGTTLPGLAKIGQSSGLPDRVIPLASFIAFSHRGATLFIRKSLLIRRQTTAEFRGRPPRAVTVTVQAQNTIFKMQFQVSQPAPPA